jgi:hypothetical protein
MTPFLVGEIKKRLSFFDTSNEDEKNLFVSQSENLSKNWAAIFMVPLPFPGLDQR